MSTRVRTTRLRAFPVALALAVALAGCASGTGPVASDGSGGPTTVRTMKTSPVLTQMPFLVAVNGGFFDAAGVKVTELPDATTSTAPIQALLAGQADVILVGSSSAVLAAVAAGQDLTTVALFAPQNAFQLVLSKPAVDRLAAAGVTPTSPIAARVAGLKGLTLATTGPGNAIDSVVRATLLEQGIEPDRDVILRPITDPAAMLAAFRQGQVDGFSYGLPVTAQPVVDGTGSVWVDYIKGDVPDLTALPTGLVVTTKRYAANHRADLVRLVAGLARGFDAISADPNGVRTSVGARYFAQLSPDLLTAAFDAAKPVFGPGPAPTEAGYEQAVALYNSDPTAKTKVTAAFAEVMDPTIAQAALAAK